jgi:peptide/nickel transport system permease protein
VVLDTRPAEVAEAPPDSFVPVRRERRTAGFLRAAGWPGLVIIAFAVAALIGPALAPYDPLAIDPFAVDVGPFTQGHVLGTDNLGRDLLSRVLYGARPTFVTALLPLTVASIFGTLLGTLAAFGPRWLGFTTMRITDVAFAFPSIMLAIAIAAMLGPSLRNAILAMTIVLIPPIARVARAAALDVSGRPYMAAARLTGASRWRIVVDFALPNMVAPIFIYCAAISGLLIIFAAGLSFLGVGVQPPSPEWGRMVADGRQSLLFNVWSSLIPGACIFIVSIAFNFFADHMRDYLDPRLR